MTRFVVAGIGTDVGKTVVSAIFTTLFSGDYWKPIESGENDLDSRVIKELLEPSKHIIHSPTYSFKNPLSPHHAARLENIHIDPQKIIPPKTKRPLIIEMAGGILVPLTLESLSIELFQAWTDKWIIVSKHYLGSINHTLLTIEVLKNKNISPLGIVFNGNPNPDTEQAILKLSKIPFLGRLLPEKKITPSIIKRYATKWQTSGIHLLK